MLVDNKEVLNKLHYNKPNQGDQLYNSILLLEHNQMDNFSILQGSKLIGLRDILLYFHTMFHLMDNIPYYLQYFDNEE